MARKVDSPFTPVDEVRGSKRLKEVLSWGMIDPELLHSFVTTVTADGAAVMLGRTMKGDALSVLVLHGDQKERCYIHSIADAAIDLDDVLYELGLEASSDGSGPTPPNARSKL